MVLILSILTIVVLYFVFRKKAKNSIDIEKSQEVIDDMKAQETIINNLTAAEELAEILKKKSRGETLK